MAENGATDTTDNWQRRYDVDALRTLALGLLIIYHSAIGFQPWANDLLFIENKQSLRGLWIIMSMLNVWRIPILFLISGMGVRFAMERRDWKQLLADRTVRILVPLIFGIFFICPINVYIGLRYYGREAVYYPNLGHLWFLFNIVVYILLLLPLFVFLKNHQDGFFLRILAGIFRRRWGLFVVALPVVLETWLIDPDPFARYYDTAHGFWLGLLCFITGFIFISSRDVFWESVERDRRDALGLAILLYLARILVFGLQGTPNLLIALESVCWMLAILGYGSVYLNKPSGVLACLSSAVYPIYIIHMPVQFAVAYAVMPLALPAVLKLVVLLTGTFGVSALVYHFILSQSGWIRPLFGMKLKRNTGGCKL